VAETQGKKAIDAAMEMRRLAAELSYMAGEIELAPHDIEGAYRYVYGFRMEFGRTVVAKLGSGVPKKQEPR